jgi:hypothetical protein
MTPTATADRPPAPLMPWASPASPAVAVPTRVRWQHPVSPPTSAPGRWAECQPGRTIAVLGVCIALSHDQWARRKTLLDGRARTRWIGGAR